MKRSRQRLGPGALAIAVVLSAGCSHYVTSLHLHGDGLATGVAAVVAEQVADAHGMASLDPERIPPEVAAYWLHDRTVLKLVVAGPDAPVFVILDEASWSQSSLSRELESSLRAELITLAPGGKVVVSQSRDLFPLGR